MREGEAEQVAGSSGILASRSKSVVGTVLMRGWRNRLNSRLTSSRIWLWRLSTQCLVLSALPTTSRPSLLQRLKRSDPKGTVFLRQVIDLYQRAGLSQNKRPDQQGYIAQRTRGDQFKPWAAGIHPSLGLHQERFNRELCPVVRPIHRTWNHPRDAFPAGGDCAQLTVDLLQPFIETRPLDLQSIVNHIRR